MAAAQQLISKKPVDLNFVLNLPEVKPIPFPSVLTDTELEDRSTFRGQIAYILEGLRLHPENAVPYRDLARIFSRIRLLKRTSYVLLGNIQAKPRTRFSCT
jgi:hypothetical protein